MLAYYVLDAERDNAVHCVISNREAAEGFIATYNQIGCRPSGLYIEEIDTPDRIYHLIVDKVVNIAGNPQR